MFDYENTRNKMFGLIKEFFPRIPHQEYRDIYHDSLLEVLTYIKSKKRAFPEKITNTVYRRCLKFLNKPKPVLASVISEMRKTKDENKGSKRNIDELLECLTDLERTLIHATVLSDKTLWKVVKNHTAYTRLRRVYDSAIAKIRQEIKNDRRV